MDDCIGIIIQSLIKIKQRCAEKMDKKPFGYKSWYQTRWWVNGILLDNEDQRRKSDVKFRIALTKNPFFEKNNLLTSDL